LNVQKSELRDRLSVLIKQVSFEPPQP
jgi:hypothetical protein